MHTNGCPVLVETPGRPSNGHAPHRGHRLRHLQQHPIGRLLPAMSPEEYAFVRVDIKAHGLHEPILLLDGMVLDGWHRLKICRELGITPRFVQLRKGADALARVISLNLARRQLTPSQRYGVFLRIAAEFPEVQKSIDAVRANNWRRQVNGTPLPCAGQRSSAIIGSMCGVGHTCVERVDRLRRLSPSMFGEMVDGKVTLTEAIHTVTVEERRKKQDALCCPPGFKPEARLYCGDFRKVLAKVAVPEISLMWADAPWQKSSVHLWDDVGRVAKRVLQPGGVLAVLPGKVFMPLVMATLSKYLRYHWTCALVHGDIDPSPQMRIVSKWTPLVLFVQGKFEPPLHLLDTVQTHSKERDRHPWQRHSDEFGHFTKYLTRPGEWVLDVMAGSFASGRAAQLLGRNFIGIDIDRAAVAKGKSWLAEGEA